MNLVTQKSIYIIPISAISFLKLFILFSAGLIFLYTRIVQGSENTGSVTGEVSVYDTGFLGKSKKKENRSGVLVYITGFKSAAPDSTPQVVQKNMKFHPEILPIVAGQKVRFPNQDSIYHNVFSVSKSNPFDLGQIKREQNAGIVAFNNPGLVSIFCNIHPQMIAYIIVLNNSAFGMTDKKGKFTIQGIPRGDYKINAWRPNAKRVTKEIKIESDKQSTVHLEIRGSSRTVPHKRKDGSQYPNQGGNNATDY